MPLPPTRPRRPPSALAAPVDPGVGGGAVTATPYPDRTADRDRWILERRPRRPVHEPTRAHSFFVESERSASGEVVPVLTILLTSRECPWRCLMCDLWTFTVDAELPAGAIPGQIRAVLHSAAGRPPAQQLKLYNGGSFFDPRAVPPADDAAVAELVQGFEVVTVESHPALIGDRCLRFRDHLAERGAALEVAMGLETVHPEVLERLNKRMTVGQFRTAAEFLHRHGIASRAFVLVKPPFLDERSALEWARRSTEFALESGVGVVVLIPVRGGNGALEALAAAGEFAPPRLATLETALDHGLRLARGRVFADLWNLERLTTCPACAEARRQRLQAANRTQVVLPRVDCPQCRT